MRGDVGAGRPGVCGPAEGPTSGAQQNATTGVDGCPAVLTLVRGKRALPARQPSMLPFDGFRNEQVGPGVREFRTPPGTATLSNDTGTPEDRTMALEGAELRGPP